MVGRADSGPPYIAQLLAAVHGFQTGPNITAMLHLAYCDESEDSQKGGRFYIVAGYFAPAADWEIFSKAWGNTLKDIGIEEFKMADCERGRGIYEGLSYAERAALQRRFISLIIGSPVWGVSSAINLRHYQDFMPRMVKARKKYAKPYFLAFQHLVEMMADVLNETEVAGPADRISYFFDEQTEYQGRAKEIFGSLTKDSGLAYSNRVGSITFDDSRRFLPLQAADIFAYENLRYLRDYRHSLRLSEPRWQWRMLQSGGRMMGRLFAREELQALCDSEGW